PGLSAIVMKLLAKSPDDRYQSAHGLIADLAHCRDLLAEKGEIPEFPPGRQDVSDRFHIPHRLYGRDQERELLMAMFAQVKEGHFSTLLISGYSGIGKTSLVNELQEPLLESNGFFVSGKFERLKRHIAYSGISQAFETLVSWLLGEGNETVSAWRGRILDAVGPNGRLLLDVIPDLELLIGPQPEVPLLGVRETQFRFNQVFRDFIDVFASHQHPLVLFLDDLQWADVASLRLLEELVTSSRRGYLLLIGAFRDHDLQPTDPLFLGLEQLRAIGCELDRIALTPLDPSHTRQLIADTLHTDAEEVTDLANEVHAKTLGNPFFTSEFLKTIHRKGCLTFDHGKQRWRWSIEAVRAIQVSDNVVEFLVKRLGELSERTRETLSLAACLGNHFSIEELSLVRECTPQQTMNDLWEAESFGLVAPIVLFSG
ncbi:MAG: AAA family ATPase, partial [Pseudomonadales bacterium]|nr:AAA family ATPase [Pseudomonadales bacterium]